MNHTERSHFGREPLPKMIVLGMQDVRCKVPNITYTMWFVEGPLTCHSVMWFVTYPKCRSYN